MRNLRSFLVLVLLLLSDFVFCQETNVWYNQVTIPPSPNAGHLGTYGEFQVSKATGAASITIPILTIEEGGISVPISLNYQSAGLRVDERPSWVGMGWSLASGGVISRTMRSLPDDGPNGFLKNLTSIPDESTVHTDLGAPLLQQKVFTHLEDLSKNIIDYEPDAFAYNFPGGGGSFFFGNDGNIHCVEHSGLKIEPIYGVLDNESTGVTGWIITTEQGLRYFFESIEYSFVNVRGEDIPEYASAWHLTRIENPVTGKKITFSYDNNNYTYIYVNPYSQSVTYERTGPILWSQVSRDQSVSTSYIKKAKFLSGIQTANQEVSFLHSPSNENYRKLNKITWQNGSSQRDFVFDYEYFQASCSDSPDCYRLKLLSLTELNGTDPKVHSFDYYEDTSLPRKRSFAQDHWGYYNGKNSNDSFIPEVTYAGQTFGDGADREPSYIHTQTGMLAKITYPTKGSSEFSYELNTYEAGLTKEDITKDIKKTLEITGTGFRDPQCADNSFLLLDGDGLCNSCDFSFNILYNLIISDPDNYDNLRHYGELVVRNASADPDIEVKRISIRNQNIQEVNIPSSLLIPGKRYTFELCAYGSVTKAIARIELNYYNKDELGGSVAREVGGLRIKEIRNFDPESNTTTYKTYDYGFGGYLVYPLPEYYSNFIARKSTPQGDEDRSRILVFSSPTGGLGPSSVPVAYETVTEWLGTKTVNTGRIVSNFLYRKDIGHRGFPYPPQISNHSLRTTLSNLRYYNTDGLLVKSEFYNYERETKASVTGFKVSRVQSTDVTGTIPDFAHEFRFENFTIFSYWNKLASKTVNTHFADKIIAESVEYTYNNPLHTYPTEEAKMNSKGERVAVSYTYPFDKTTCVNNCFTLYLEDIDACKAESIKHSIEVNECASKFGNCKVNYLNCMASKDAAIKNECYTFGTLSIPCAARVSKRFDCAENFGNCVNTNYAPCLNLLEDQYALCQKNTFVNYKICQQNFDECLLNEFDTEPDLAEKAVDLLSINNMVAAPLQTTISLHLKPITLAPRVLKSTFLQYGIFNDRPLQQEATVALNNGASRKVMTINKYDNAGNPLEVTDHQQGLTKSYIWGYNNELLIAEFQNAASDQIAYTSFESASNEGNWSYVLSTSMQNKTGVRAHLLAGAPLTKSQLDPAKRYTLSFWAKSGTPSVTSVVSNNDATSADMDGWRYFEKVVSGTTNVVITGSGSTVIDEVRLGPEGSVVSTFTHEPGFGLTCTNDQNNNITYFKYDAVGRLAVVADHYRNILKFLKYNYKD